MVLAREWLRPPGALFISRSGNRGSIAVFYLSLCLITRVKQIMLFATTRSCLDPTFLLCSHTLSLSFSFPLNSSAVALEGEVKHHKYQAAQHTQEGFSFSSN